MSRFFFPANTASMDKPKQPWIAAVTAFSITCLFTQASEELVGNARVFGKQYPAFFQQLIDIHNNGPFLTVHPQLFDIALLSASILPLSLFDNRINIDKYRHIF